MHIGIFLIVGVQGTIVFKPYHEEDESEASSCDEEEAVSSSDEAVSRWCTVRKNFNIFKYGDASAYIGLKCTMSDQSGTITAVMKNSTVLSGELHFAIQMDTAKTDDACFTYALCKDMMSTNKRNKNKVGTRVCMYVNVCVCLCMCMCVCLWECII